MGANKKIISTEDNFKNNFPHGNAPEYDKLFQNRNRINKVGRGSSMNQEDWKRLERKQNGMKVILEFPRKSEREEDIKNEENMEREVKGVLSIVLQEYLMKNGEKEVVHERK